MAKKEYTARRDANDQSRNTADNHRELWTVEEIEILQQFWEEVPLEQIALTVGHTVEACRQKFYLLRKEETAAPVVERRLREVNTWTTGFTSLDDMGY